MILVTYYLRFCALMARADWLVPTLARLVFAGVLLSYFWVSGLTKLGDGLFGIFMPSAGAYAQIFPRAMEAVGYDHGQLGVLHWLVVLAGTWAEFLLSFLIVTGLLTRLAALGMIGFVALQTLTDLFGHGAIAEPGGKWFAQRALEFGGHEPVKKREKQDSQGQRATPRSWLVSDFRRVVPNMTLPPWRVD